MEAPYFNPGLIKALFFGSPLMTKMILLGFLSRDGADWTQYFFAVLIATLLLVLIGMDWVDIFDIVTGDRMPRQA